MNTTGLFSAYAKPVICWNYRPLTSYCKAMILNKKKKPGNDRSRQYIYATNL